MRTPAFLQSPGFGAKQPAAPALSAQLDQFLLQTLLVLLVGATIGLERTVVPLLAEQEFHIGKASLVTSFVVSFGLVKALLNLWGASLSERWGRKPLLVVGWLFAVPVPFLIIFAQSWWLIVFANVLLGVNQGLTWSMTITAQLDLAGRERRGLAAGVNEFAGYAGVAVSALVTSLLAEAFGLRPAPFLFGIGLIGLGLLLSVLFAKETLRPTAQPGAATGLEPLRLGQLFRWVSWGDRRAFAISQAGLVEKFVDALVWLAYPVYFLSKGLGVGQIGILAFVYGATWGLSQLLTGPLSDRMGRRPLIVAGMFFCAAGVLFTVLWNTHAAWLASAALTGLGMAMLYPTLAAAISDIAPAHRQATTLGVYRFWRDGGYAIGALLIGLLADTLGLAAAFYVVAGAMAASGVVAALLLPETLQRAGEVAQDSI